ncbi:MAG: Glutaredoxin 4 [Chlamydiia bacterium]|nr:Glutaredoxin 4 [Chlamydiia bacterium]
MQRDLEKVLQSIDEDVKKHPVILYMKGTKLMPVCGFSSQVVAVLNSLGVDFETRNILDDEDLRAAIKVYSDWPTLPQLYVNAEFIGGCDIIIELFESGELEQIISKQSV